MAGRKIGLLIGNGRFEENSGFAALRCPANDVEGLRELLADEVHGGYDEVETLVNATQRTIQLALLKTLRGVGFEDRVIVYYSGHGSPDEAGSLYLAAADTTKETLEATGLAMESVVRYIRGSRSQQVVLILDCCFSGRVDQLFTKGEVADQARTALPQTLSGTGFYVLTASTATQLAIEREGDRYGLLTKHILDGIKRGRADLDDDGVVTMHELTLYVQQAVKQEGKQEPLGFAQRAGGGAFEIARTGRPAMAVRRAEVETAVLDARLKFRVPWDVVRCNLELISVEAFSRDGEKARAHLDQLHHAMRDPDELVDTMYSLAQPQIAEAQKQQEILAAEQRRLAEAKAKEQQEAQRLKEAEAAVRRRKEEEAEQKRRELEVEAERQRKAQAEAAEEEARERGRLIAQRLIQEAQAKEEKARQQAELQAAQLRKEAEAAERQRKALAEQEERREAQRLKEVAREKRREELRAAVRRFWLSLGMGPGGLYRRLWPGVAGMALVPLLIFGMMRWRGHAAGQGVVTPTGADSNALRVTTTTEIAPGAGSAAPAVTNDSPNAGSAAPPAVGSEGQSAADASQSLARYSYRTQGNGGAPGCQGTFTKVGPKQWQDVRPGAPGCPEETFDYDELGRGHGYMYLQWSGHPEYRRLPELSPSVKSGMVMASSSPKGPWTALWAVTLEGASKDPPTGEVPSGSSQELSESERAAWVQLSNEGKGKMAATKDQQPHLEYRFSGGQEGKLCAGTYREIHFLHSVYWNRELSASEGCTFNAGDFEWMQTSRREKGWILLFTGWGFGDQYQVRWTRLPVLSRTRKSGVAMESLSSAGPWRALYPVTLAESVTKD